MKYEDMIKNYKLYDNYLLKYRDYYCNKYNLPEDAVFPFDENAFREFYEKLQNKPRTPKRILFDLGLKEEEAIALFRYLMAEVAEEDYQKSERLFNQIANKCGYKSYMDYLEHSPECF